VTIDAAITEAVAAAMVPVLAELRALRAQVAALRARSPAEPELLTVRQFAARAGLSTCTVRRRIADGTLSHVRVGSAIRVPSMALRPADPARIAELARAAREPRP
jgi:excisionase family DNA binding protein